jgi:hypothetical protein
MTRDAGAVPIEPGGSPGADERRPRVAALGPLGRVSELGSAAQASIPGLYAWAVTVAPAAWGKAGTLPSKAFAVLGLVILGAALVLERRSRTRARWSRPLSVWGLSLTSAAVWLLVPGALAPLRLEATRGLAGMLGWALFAFSSAAPAIKRDAAASDRIVLGALLRPRTRIPKGDVVFMAAGAVVACMLQVFGWQSAPPERAVLVRLVTLAAGLAVLGSATTIALARHTRRVPAVRRQRVRRALPWLAVLTILVVSGVFVQFVLSR